MVYRLSVEIARWFRQTRWPHGASKLRDQGVRAAASVALNIAEGRMTGEARGTQHYRIAHGSAAEACAGGAARTSRRADAAWARC